MEPKNDLEILIVEDSPTQLEQLQHSLETHDYKVITAVNGKLGLEAARKHSPAIIISDILMPEMDGYDLCKAIRSDEILKDTPIVLLTSLSSPADVIEALKCGADNFIRKPYDEQNLLLRINNILMSKKLRSNTKFEFGVEISLGGNRHFITSERQQILDLLISTYEQAVELCGTLKIREEQISRSNEILRGIYQIAKGLNGSMTRQEVIEQVLDRALLLPDVRAGWFSVYEGESNFKLAGSRGLPPVLEVPGALDGDCLCRRKVLAGEINRSMNITECERLKKANGDTLGLRSHVTIPLKSGNVLMGILNLVGAENVLFDDNDLAVLNGIGNQIGAALDRCLIHENLEALVIERTAALTTEIIERKKTEESLRESENRYRTLAESAENATIGIYRTTPDGKILMANPALVSMLGYTSFEELKKRDLTKEGWEQSYSRELFIEPIEKYGEIRGVEFLWKRKDGKEIWVSESARAIRNSKGETLYYEGTIENITERKQAEEALQRSEEKYRSIFESAIVGIYQTTTEGRYLSANPTHARILGYESPEDLMECVSDLNRRFYVEPGRREEFTRLTQEQGAVNNFESQVYRKDGSIIWISETARSIRNVNNQLVGFEGVTIN
ncbi:MAG: PAS domain S-box protein, partial [Ignavibacteriaceae bacterium]